MKFSDNYSEPEAMYIFGVTKYKLRQLNIASKSIGGKNQLIYLASGLLHQATKKGLVDEQFSIRQRKVDVERRARDFEIKDYVPLSELLHMILVSRQRVNQVVKSTTKTIRIKIWGMWMYDKVFWTKWVTNPGRLAILENKIKLYNSWLASIQNW